MKQLELTVLLCLIWVLSLLYGELFAYWVPALFTCSWPHLSNSKGETNRNGYEAAEYVEVAVIADPQLMDKTSLHLPPKSIALEVAQFYTDLYMRRAFFGSVMPFRPHIILFLGDYFDGGPYLSDQEWQESWTRFKHIFGLDAQGTYENMQVYYIPGNHDIGYASLHCQRPEVIRRFEETFGIRNYRFRVGKVDFIAVDAQTLDGDPERGLASETWEFVKNVSIEDQAYPRTLLTHIPLYRQDWTNCGPHRNSPIINQRITRTVGSEDIWYQNYITEKSSNSLLDLIKPIFILSGHDHDQCTVSHESKFGAVREQTLGTISWQQGNLHPSFMLLSASNSIPKNGSNGEEAVITHLCYLPKQTHIYIWYLLLFVITILALLLWPTSSKSFRHQCSNIMGYSRQLIIDCSLFRGGIKEKNEDDNYEYEMMWDAEGSMHLVKKPLNTATKNSSERSTVDRGNVVMRPTAKKFSQEIDISMYDHKASGTGFDQISKLPPRTSKSKTAIVIQRLVRTLRMLIVIAAVNVPLYMMLLFKDWIDK